MVWVRMVPWRVASAESVSVLRMWYLVRVLSSLSHFGVVGLGVRGEDGDCEGADVGRDVGGRAGLMVAASGEKQGEDADDGAGDGAMR
jgi:hypothetical protein